MGVPGLNSWFVRNHRHAYVSYFNTSWDHVYIDMASILHAAMKKGMQITVVHVVLDATPVLMHFSTCSVQPSSFSQNPICKAGQYHGAGVSPKECHVCFGRASTLSKALDTKVWFLFLLFIYLTIHPRGVRPHRYGTKWLRISSGGPCSAMRPCNPLQHSRTAKPVCTAGHYNGRAAALLVCTLHSAPALCPCTLHSALALYSAPALCPCTLHSAPALCTLPPALCTLQCCRDALQEEARKGKHQVRSFSFRTHSIRLLGSTLAANIFKAAQAAEAVQGS